MWITSGYILLTPAVVLHCIELMSPEPKTLEALFPGFSGIMPPVEEFDYLERRYEVFRSSGQIRNFERFDNGTMARLDSEKVFRRAHIIIGWDSVGCDIDNLCILFYNLQYAYIIFDMIQDKWLTVPQDLAHELGVGRRYTLVAARDEAAARHVVTSKNPVYREAHIRACRQAHIRADLVEGKEVQLLQANRMSDVNSIRVIQEEYSQEYNRAFALYLYRHGEFNINGHRGRHP